VLIVRKGGFSYLDALKKVAPVIITFILVLSPWIVRNYIVHNKFIPFTTEGGAALLAGNNKLASGDGLCNLGLLFNDKENERLSRMGEVDKDAMYRGKALEFFAKDYRKLPKLFFKKLLVLWDIYDTYYDESGKSHRNFNIVYSIVLMFALFGIVRSIRLKPPIGVSLMLYFFVYFSVIAMIFLGESRFRNPVEPFLIFFAGSGIISMYDSIKRKTAFFLIILGVIGVNLVLYAYADAFLNWVRASFKFIIKM
jgi:hypothetical protein